MSLFKWKNAIHINIIILRCVGLWPKGNDVYGWDLYTIYSFLSINFFINGHSLSQAANLFFIYTDLEAVAANIYITITDLLASLKVYYFVKNIALIKELMKTLDTEEFQPKTQEQRILVKPGLKAWKIAFALFWTPSSLTLSLWAIYPVLDGTYKEYRLPFSAWYPHDTKKPLFYELTYLYQVLSIWFLATANISFDTFSAALMMYVGTQCEVLCNRLKYMASDPESSYDDKLYKVMQHHKNILKFAKHSNYFFNMIALGQFFTSGITLGITMFQLTLVAPLSSEFFSLLAYQGAMTVQLSLYCWFGNEVESKSSQIPYAAFQSDWTGIPIEAKKNLIIFIMRSQKPIQMSAINLFSLSLTTFTRILRTSWSYFAVLRQVNTQI